MSNILNEFSENGGEINRLQEGVNVLAAESIQLLLGSAYPKNESKVAKENLGNLILVDGKDELPPADARPHRRVEPGGGMVGPGVFMRTPERMKPQESKSGARLQPGGDNDDPVPLQPSPEEMKPQEELRSVRRLKPGGDDDGPAPLQSPLEELKLQEPEKSVPAEQQVPAPPESNVETNELLNIGQKFGEDLPLIVMEDGTARRTGMTAESESQAHLKMAEQFGKIIDSGNSSTEALGELNDYLEKSESSHRFRFLGPKNGTPTGLVMFKDGIPVSWTKIPRQSR